VVDMVVRKTVALSEEAISVIVDIANLINKKFNTVVRFSTTLDILLRAVKKLINNEETDDKYVKAVAEFIRECVVVG